MTDTTITITPTDLDFARARELLAGTGPRDLLVVRVAEALARERVQGVRPPLAIRLHCPECGELHIDEGQWATRVHHTHSCQNCGATWRPAVGPTVGVRFLPGFKNAPPAPPVQQAFGHALKGPGHIEEPFTLKRPIVPALADDLAGEEEIDAAKLAEDLARDDDTQPPPGAELAAKVAWADALYEDLRRVDPRVLYNGTRENIGAYVKERFEVVMAEHPSLRESIETLRARCRNAEAERNELREKVTALTATPTPESPAPAA